MKTWTMPKIEIENFVPNESVAACTPYTDFELASGTYAMDILDPIGSHKYTETINGSTSGKLTIRASGNTLPTGPYGLINFYHYPSDGTPNNNDTYTRANGWESAGQFYVYIVSNNGKLGRYAWLFSDESSYNHAVQKGIDYDKVHS